MHITMVETGHITVTQRYDFRCGGITLKGEYSADTLTPERIPALLDHPTGRVVLARKGEFTMVVPAPTSARSPALAAPTH